MARLFAAAVFGVAFACSGAFASEPGQPLDCSDWVFLQPGYSCTRFGPPGDGSAQEGFGTTAQFDNQGRFFRVSNRGVTPIGLCGAQTRYRIALQWLDGAAWNTLAYVDERCTSPGVVDQIQSAAAAAALTFDASNGRLIVSLVSYCNDGSCVNYPPGTGDYWLASIAGFATTFDVLQSFTPQPASLGFRVPYMPEGMPGAEHFDTYWGNLTHPLDFPQAHPLQCGYPAAAPHVGDYLTVADTVPTPPPGQGVYYVTSATYQGATRYGRKATAGHLTGRDPELLPTCMATNNNGAIPVDAPTTITQPGSYVLTRDVSVLDGPAISINYASNVSLNLNGFHLGRTGSSYGGAISGAGMFVEIYGGQIEGGGVDLNCSFCTIREVTVRDSPGGVVLEGVHNTVEHTRHFSSHIHLDDAVGAIVRDNVLQSGFIVIESGSAFHVSHNALTGGYIWLDGDSNGVVLDNMVTGSATHGIYGLGSGNRFAGNVVSESAGFGLYFDSDHHGSTYSGNVSRGNHGTGCANPAGNADFCDEGTGNESGGDNFMPDLR
jgi:parallel beta-helix repeat protein